MFGSVYPRVKQSLAKAALNDTPPALIIDNAGSIQAANLMAFWLWDKLPAAAPLDPGALLGKSIYDVVAGEIERIPLSHNIEAYSKRLAVMRRLSAEPGADPALYSSFIDAIQRDPNRAYLYEHCSPHPDHEEEYPLTIAPPGRSGQDMLLNFQVSIFRLIHDQGFLLTYNLLPSSFLAIEEQYSRLHEIFGEKVYALKRREMPRSIPEPASSPTYVRSYYPMLVQDALWYNVRENRAQQLLIGQSAVGIHFFEMFFSPVLREWMGPLHETSSPRAIKYFDDFTRPFTREDHDLHKEYERMMQRLLRVPGFRDALDLARRASLTLHFPEHPTAPFYACRVFLPWRFMPGFTLQFRNIARYLYDESFAQEDQRHYQIILVPENYETDVALILLHLIPSTARAGSDEQAALDQFRWGLAAIMTIQEGLNSKDEGGYTWEPESAFARIHNDLSALFPASSDETAGALTGLMRETIAAIDKAGAIRGQTLLMLLHSAIAAQPGLEMLAKFLENEPEMDAPS